MHNDLGNEWVRFQQSLVEAEQMLKKHKVKYLILIRSARIHSLFNFLVLELFSQQVGR